MDNTSRSWKLRVGFTLLASVAGCTAGPQLARYPRRVVDRPYTLPDGVASWGGGVAVQMETRTDQPAEFSVPIASPLEWGYALSDDLTLHYVSPALSYQFLNSDHHRFGVTGGLLQLGFGPQNLIAVPGLLANYRYRFGDGYAIDGLMSVRAALSTGDDAVPLGTSLGLRLWRQVTDTWAVQATVRAGLEQDLGVASADPTARFPLAMGSIWNVTPQWDLSLTYAVSAFWLPSRDDGLVDQTLTGGFRHYF